MDFSSYWQETVVGLQSMSRVKLVFLVLITLLLLKIVHVHLSIVFSPLRNLPSPPRWPILYHLGAFIMNPHTEEVYYQWMDKYGKSGRFRMYNLLGPERIVSDNLEDIRTVLVTKSHKFSKPDLIKDLSPELTKGLLLSEGKFHAWLRKLLTPAFSYSGIQSFTPIFAKHAQKLVKHWHDKIQQERGNSRRIIVEDDLKHLTFDVTCETIFGRQENTITEDGNEFTQTLLTFMQSKFNIWTFMVQTLAPVLKKLPFGIFQRMKQAENDVLASVEKIIQEKRNRNDSKSQNRDLLGIIMKLKTEETDETLTNELLRHNALTFLAAGVDTTETALTWTLYLLALHQDIQERAREEARALSLSEINFPLEGSPSLNYINAVIKESLRLNGPVPIVIRHAISDVVLNDIVLPRGYAIELLLGRVQISENMWKNPKEFLPDRHLNREADAEYPTKYPMSFLPFSIGPHNCIGQRLATLEMKIVLAILLRTFRFSLPQDHPKVGKKFLLTMKPSPSPKLEVTLLDGVSI